MPFVGRHEVFPKVNGVGLGRTHFRPKSGVICPAPGMERRELVRAESYGKIWAARTGAMLGKEQGNDKQ